LADLFDGYLPGNCAVLHREEGAGGEAHQIVDVSHRVRLIHIVDSPDEPAFEVTPRSEILDVQIAHTENFRSTPDEHAALTQIAAFVFPEFYPTIKAPSQKNEARRIAPHLLVLVDEIALDDEKMFPQPLFVTAAGLIDRGKRFHGEVVSAR